MAYWHSALSPEVGRILDQFELSQQQQQQQLESQQAKAAPPPSSTSPRVFIFRDNGVETIATGQTGPRMIRGVASTPTIMKSIKWQLESSGCRVPRMPVPLLCKHHELGQIGDVTLVTIHPQKVTIQAVIWSNNRAADYAWSLIENGEMRALSSGNRTLCRTVVDGISFADRWELREVSICRKGANPDCTFEIFTGKLEDA